jgi:DNA-binding transcriptional regulator YiaG
MTGKQLVLLGVAARRAKDGSGRRIREQAKVPMRFVAQNVGVKEATISRWETGQRQPRGDAAIKWALLLDELERAHGKSVA